MSRHVAPGSGRRDRGWISWLVVGLLGAVGSVLAVARSRTGERTTGSAPGTVPGGPASGSRARSASDGSARGDGRTVDAVGPGAHGGTVGGEGTPVPVDVLRDRRWRPVYVLFLIGPIIWITHFGVVYAAAEMGCTGGGRGLELFDPPVPANVTVVATVIAVLACLAAAEWGRRWWKHSRDGVWFDDPDQEADAETVDSAGTLSLIGALLSLLSVAAVLFVGVSGVVFGGC